MSNTNPTNPTDRTKSEVVIDYCYANDIPIFDFVPTELQVSLHQILADNQPDNTMNEKPINKTKIEDAMNAVTTLRNHGYAVVIITPYRLCGVDPYEVEESMRDDSEHFIDMNRKD